MTVAITRTDLTSRELHAAGSRSHDARAARRMVAVALVLESAPTTSRQPQDAGWTTGRYGIGSIATTRKVLRGFPGAGA